jgi:hypothetical protein
LLRDIEYADALTKFKSSRKKNIALEDSSTCYFFNIFKNKTTQSSIIMSELLLPDGSIITDKTNIVKEVHKYYSSFYSTDQGFKEGQEEALVEILKYLRST